MPHVHTAHCHSRAERLAEAEALYRRALNVRRSLFGPSAALAALLNNLGKLQLRLGRPEQALPLLQEAVVLAREYAGENSLNALAAMAGLGEAQAVTGEAEAARPRRRGRRWRNLSGAPANTSAIPIC